MAHAVEVFGRLDVVVNNAGVARPNYLEDLVWSDLEETSSVHLLGAFHVTRPAWPVLALDGGGCVVNTTSAVGFFGQPRSSGYGAASVGHRRHDACPRPRRRRARHPRQCGRAGRGFTDGRARLQAADAQARSGLRRIRGARALPRVVSPDGRSGVGRGGRLARLVLGATRGLFDENLDPDRAAAYLADGFESLEVTAPGSAMEEIDLIRSCYPELHEPMRYDVSASRRLNGLSPGVTRVQEPQHAGLGGGPVRVGQLDEPLRSPRWSASIICSCSATTRS